MGRALERREFLKTSLRAGLTTAVGGPILHRLVLSPLRAQAKDFPDIAVVAGDDYGRNAANAVELLGGIGRFVHENSRVLILANAQSSHPGTYTNPGVIRTVIRLCKKAGAKEINLVSWLALKNWESTGQAQVAAEEGAGLKLIERDEANFKPVPVPAGKALREARILNIFFDHDVFINMPVTKDHAGNKFTGTMKNLMGLNSPKTNRTFHKQNWQTDAGAIEHLDQCIADLSTVVKPTLNIVDATEFITTNGPFGPGELLKPKKVVAGVDRVAIDAYCASLWGLRGDDIIMIKRGQEHNLGRLDLKKVRIKEINV
ncbi:MAG: DUF362 domain-containing protein [Candidatus Aminicenantales bacterium]